MPLIPWRKLRAGLQGESDNPNDVVQHIVQTTVTQMQETTYATTVTAGVVKLATAVATAQGDDATLAVTPDGLAGSIMGEKVIYLKILTEGDALTTGDGKMYVTIPDTLNGMDLVDADAAVYTVSSSGTPTIQIHNDTDNQDILSTLITIDINKKTSYDASAQPVINTSYDDVVSGDQLRIDVDAAGTGTEGLDVILAFRMP